MFPRVRQFVARLQQPEYTGANRCLPCTAVNILVAVVVAVAVALFTTPAIGVVVLLTAFAAIYVRGYLVPGTPELTKRYLPERVLRWFGKAPELPDPGETVDVEAYLLEAGAVQEDDVGGLVLTDGFAAAWEVAVDDVATEPEAAVANLLDLDEPGIEERGEACVVTDGGMQAADWPSRAALLLDLGAVEMLAERDPAWRSRDRPEQGRILAGLRVFAETCPACGGSPELGEETVESCCRRAEVITYSCPDCGARLLELET